MADDITGLVPDDDGDGERLELSLDVLAEADVRTPEMPTPGNVNVTLRLRDGSLLRLATTVDEARLTLATADGGVSVPLDSRDVGLVEDALAMARKDLRRGSSW